jgi:hypothetical protein
MTKRLPLRRSTAAAVRSRRSPVLELLEDRYLMAGWSPVGPETLVNDTTAGVQETTFEGKKAIASDDSGHYVVVWSGSGAGDPDGVYARLYDAAGAVGPSFRVNTFTAGEQTEAAVAMDNSGNFVVTWSSNGQDGGGWGVYGQRFNSAGAAQGGEFRVNVTTSGNQHQPAVAMDAAGNFVATWTSDNLDGTGTGIAARRYNAAGTALGGEVHVNAYTDGNQLYSAVAMDDAGNYTVVWQSDYVPTSSIGIFAQRYNTAGGAVGTWFVVNTTTAGFQLTPSIGMSATGAFVVAWTSDSQDGSGRGIFAQRYSAAGAKAGGEFGVNATTAGDQQYPSVAVENSGAFVIAWESAAQDASGWGIYAREYTAAGAPIGAEYRVNKSTAGDQRSAAVAMVGNGDFVAVWSGSGSADPSGVYSQSYKDLVPGVTVTPFSGLTTTESGGTATFTVVLSSRPTANVTIALASSDTTEGTVSAASLVFTRNNWDVPQTVTVTGVNDALNDGDVTYTIVTGATASSDATYNGLAVVDVSATNLDTTPLPNSPPVVTTTAAVLSYVENAGAVTVDSGLTVSDANDATLTGAVVAIVGYVAGQDVLSYAGGSGITATWDGNAGALTLSGVATVAQYQAALRSVTYVNVSENPDTSARAVRFLVNDGQADSAPASRAVSIGAVNDPPVAAGETYASEQDTVLTVPVGAGVLTNDSDVDGPALSAVLVQQAQHGTVLLYADGSFAYTPAAGWWGADQFTYTADDGAGGSDTAVVTVQVARAAGITVTPTMGLTTSELGGQASFTVVLDRQPTATVRIDLGMSQGGEGVLSATQLFFDATNWSTPQTVTITGIDDGVNDGDRFYTITLAPAASADPLYNGLDAADVSVTNVATPPPTPQSPAAAEDAYNVTSGAALTVAPAGVLSNDSSPTGQALTATLVQQAAHGVVSLNPDGSFTYTPAAGFVGTDQFRYAATDSNGSTPAEVTITVDAAPDPVPDPNPDPGPGPDPEPGPQPDPGPGPQPNPEPEPGGAEKLDPVLVPPVVNPPLSAGDVAVPVEEVQDRPRREEAPVVVPPSEVPAAQPAVAVSSSDVAPADEAKDKGPARLAPAHPAVAVPPPQAMAAMRSAAREHAERDEDDAERGDGSPKPAVISRATAVGEAATAVAASPVALVRAAGPLAVKLEAMSKQLAAADTAHNVTIRTVSQVALAMTAGYVMWSLRGASLLASLLTSLPLWRSLDPLPILEARAEREKVKAAKRRKSRKKDKRTEAQRAPDDDQVGPLEN